MTRTRSIQMVAAALAMLTLAVAPRASAQQTSEARIQDLIQKAAEKVAANAQAQAGSTPAAPAQSAGATGPVIRLTLDDAVKMALDRNLDIAVQRLNPQISDIAVASARSVYAINLGSVISQQSASTISNSTISGGAAGAGITTGTQTVNGSITKLIPWGGANLSATLNNNRTTTNNTTALFDPNYNTNWSATYTQPLFKNFKIDSNRQTIYVAQVNRDISDVQLRATITNTVSNVRNAYWDYVYTQQAVLVAQQVLDLANNLVRDNTTRVEVGTMAPIDVVTAQAEQATDQQALVAAESNRRTAELALKKLISGGTDDATWTSRLDAVERPDFNPQPVDLSAAIRRALAERTDLDIVKKNEQINDITLKYLHNQTLPQADLALRYGVIGQGGTQFLSSGTGINRVVTGTIPGGYSDALSSLLKQTYPTWNLSLTLNYPLGQSAQEASVARAQVQLNQISAQLKQIELQVANDVTNSVIQVENTAQSVQASNASVELAQRKLEAEQSKFDVGMSTNYNVVLAQRDLATARNSQLSALRNYRKAQVELERLQQTALSSAGITVLGR